MRAGAGQGRTGLRLTTGVLFALNRYPAAVQLAFLQVEPGSAVAFVDGRPAEMPRPAALRGGRLYVPLRFAARFQP